MISYQFNDIFFVNDHKSLDWIRILNRNKLTSWIRALDYEFRITDPRIRNPELIIQGSGSERNNDRSVTLIGTIHERDLRQ
jgi:hypothetical protein